MKTLAIILLALACGACEETAGERYDRLIAEKNGSASQEAAWIGEAQLSVQRKLRDGDSATFRSVAIHQFNRAPLVCGEVNANNGFGGKAGFQRFIFAGSVGTYLEEEMAPGEMNKSWAQFCTG